MKIVAYLQIPVLIDMGDTDAIERVTGPGGDEWRASLYDLKTVEDVANHLAFNCVANGVESAHRLDGWGDLPEGAVTMEVNRGGIVYLDVEIEP